MIERSPTQENLYYLQSYLGLLFTFSRLHQHPEAGIVLIIYMTWNAQTKNMHISELIELLFDSDTNIDRSFLLMFYKKVHALYNFGGYDVVFL